MIFVYLVKGIEFDVVIIYDVFKDVYSNESVCRLFYIVCMWVMYELYFYCVGEVSFFVFGVDLDSFEFIIIFW